MTEKKLKYYKVYSWPVFGNHTEHDRFIAELIALGFEPVGPASVFIDPANDQARYTQT